MFPTSKVRRTSGKAYPFVFQLIVAHDHFESPIFDDPQKMMTSSKTLSDGTFILL